MSFFNPWSLAWLAPMAGLIVLMYILKLRRRDVIVSSTLLWRQVIRDVQANAPFQRLRKNLLLFLQLAAIALLVLALARPFLRSFGLGGRSIILIVDTSASMAATDVAPSRLDAARREAHRIVSDMHAEDQVMVLSAASRPEALTGFTGDRIELHRAIDSLRTHDTTTNMRDAVNLAAALVAARDASEIDVVSDGDFPPVANVNLGKTHVVFHGVGRTGRNVGITAVDYRRSLTGERSVEVLVTIHNFDTAPHTFDVELAHGSSTVDAHEVTLKPGEDSPDVFDLAEPTAPLTLNVRLDVNDDLATDNQAALVITPRKVIKTLLVSNQNVPLEDALRVDPSVSLSEVKPAAFTASTGYDVVIFDQSAPKTLPEGNYLFVNCTSNQSPASAGASADFQGLVDANKSHPVLRYVDFGTTRWASLRAGRPAPWGQEIATGENGAGIVAGEKDRMRALWLGFGLDVADGYFWKAVAYPIFVSNAVRWLARSDDAAEVQIRTGSAVTMDAPPGAGRVVVTKPDGAKRELAVSARGGVVFDDADEVGIYTATGANGFRRMFAANLADYDESNIAPQSKPGLGANPASPAGRRVMVNREIWPWLAGALVALLAFEWWAFHRRVYVT